MEFISERIFENFSKMKILVFEIFEKGQILGPFSGLAPSKLKFFSKKFKCRICAYGVFYLPIFREIDGGGIHPPPGRVKDLLFIAVLPIQRTIDTMKMIF